MWLQFAAHFHSSIISSIVSLPPSLYLSYHLLSPIKIACTFISPFSSFNWLSLWLFNFFFYPKNSLIFIHYFTSTLTIEIDMIMNLVKCALIWIMPFILCNELFQSLLVCATWTFTFPIFIFLNSNFTLFSTLNFPHLGKDSRPNFLNKPMKSWTIQYQYLHWSNGKIKDQNFYSFFSSIQG